MLSPINMIGIGNAGIGNTFTLRKFMKIKPSAGLHPPVEEFWDPAKQQRKMFPPARYSFDQGSGRLSL